MGLITEDGYESGFIGDQIDAAIVKANSSVQPPVLAAAIAAHELAYDHEALGEPGPAGSPGASAYALAVAGGFVGTQAAWLASLKGVPGTPGAPGAPGANGSPGASAYALAVAGGFVGTLEQWLASLKGEPGADGEDGLDGDAGSGSSLLDMNLAKTDKRNFFLTPQVFESDVLVRGGLSMGELSPMIKAAKFSGTTATTEGGTIDVDLGVPAESVISLSVIVSPEGKDCVIPCDVTAGYQFRVSILDTTLRIKNHATNSENILNSPFVASILYESA